MIRAMFVPLNKWGKLRPCPHCRTDGYARPPDKRLTGVMRLIGQVIASGLYLYVCYTCNREAESSAAN